MLKPNGVLAIATWQHVPWVEEFQPIFDQNPDFPPWPHGVDMMKHYSETKEDWDKPSDLKQHLEATGFVDVQANVYEHQSNLSVEESKASLSGMLGMVKSQLWTAEQSEKYGDTVQKAFGDFLTQKYKDGTVTWTWRAVVGTGRKPA